LAVTAPALAAGQVDWDACKGDDPDRSIAACTRIIQGRGETAQRLANAHYNRGVAYKDKGDLDRAIADFTEAIRLNPRHVMALGNRGAAYSAKDDNDRAIADFNEAIRLDPNFADAYFNRGITYQDKGDLDRAIADYSEVIRLNPKFTQAYFIEASRTRTGAISTAPSQTTTRRSGSIPSSRPPTSTGATRTRTRAMSTAPSPTSARRSGSL